MTLDEAIKTLKENSCAMCAYCSKDMDSCDIRSCDNKDAIKVLEQEPCEELIRMKKDLKGRQKKIEKLISSDVRHACEAERFKELYELECRKNCVLFLKFKDVSKELALLKNSKEEQT